MTKEISETMLTEKLKSKFASVSPKIKQQLVLLNVKNEWKACEINFRLINFINELHRWPLKCNFLPGSIFLHFMNFSLNVDIS